MSRTRSRQRLPTYVYEQGGAGSFPSSDDHRRRPRVIRAFFSSTFRDFQTEREHLMDAIFPRFERLCAQRGAQFVPIDLRWGITGEQSVGGQVIKICLGEITKDTWFFTMLGERYGWSRATDPLTPIPAGTTVEELKKLPSSKLLQLTFEQGSQEFDWVMDYSERSITELEILHNFLRAHENKESPNTQFARAYFREAKSGDQRDTELASEQLAQLKSRISKSPVAAVDYADSDALGEVMFTDLVTMLDLTYPPNEKYSARDAEHDAMAFFAQGVLSVYVRNQEMEDAVDGFFGERPILLVGKRGSGKSAAAAQLAELLRARLTTEHTTPHCVITHHVGASASSTDTCALMRRILVELKDAFSLPKEVPEDDASLKLMMGEMWALAAQRGSTLLVIDGIDELDDERSLSWIPMPPRLEGGSGTRFHVLITATVGSHAVTELSEAGWAKVELTALDTDRKRLIIKRFMQRFAKTLTPEQENRIVAARQSDQPLFLRVALEELRCFGSYERLNSKFDELMDCEGVAALYRLVVERLVDSFDKEASAGESHIHRLLELVLVSRHGLREMELLQLLQLPRLAFTPIFRAVDQRLLVNRGGFFCLANPYLATAVKEMCSIDVAKSQGLHRRLASFFRKTYGAVDARRVLHAWHCQQAGDAAELAKACTEISTLPLYMREENMADLNTYCKKESGAFETFNEVLDKLAASQIAHMASLALQRALGDAVQMRLVFEETDADQSGALDAGELAPLLARLGCEMKAAELGLLVQEMSAASGVGVGSAAGAPQNTTPEVGFAEFLAWTARVLELECRPVLDLAADHSIAARVAKRRMVAMHSDRTGPGWVLELTRKQAMLAREFGKYDRAAVLFSKCVELDRCQLSGLQEEQGVGGLRGLGPVTSQTVAMSPGAVALTRALVQDLYHQQEIYIRYRVPPAGGKSGSEVAEALLQEALRRLDKVDQSSPRAGSARDEPNSPGQGHVTDTSAQAARGAVLQGFAYVMFYSGRLDEAETTFKRATTLRRTARDLRNLADSLNGLGSVYEKKAKQAAEGAERDLLFERARLAYSESLELRLKVLSTRSADVGQVATSLGSLNLELKDFPKARRYYEQASEAYTASLGKQHVRNAWAYIGQANVSYAEGDVGAACKDMEQALALRRFHIEDEHSSLIKACADPLAKWRAEL